MSFLTPLAFGFLGMLPVVVLLHLLRERRKVTRISSLLLWYWAEKEVHGSRLRSVVFSILLLIHLVIAVLLALALSRPVLSGFAGDVERNLILILDATTSMAATDIQPSRFSAAQTRAGELLAALSEGDTFVVIEMRATSTILSRGSFEEWSWARELIALSKPIGVGAEWRGALMLANAVVDPVRENRIIVLSDAAIPDLSPALTPVMYVQPEWEIINSNDDGMGQQEVENVAIVALTSRPLLSGETQVLMRAVNYANQDVERTLKLSVDGLQAEQRDLNIPASGIFDQIWTFTPDVEFIEVFLVGADALSDDDQATLVLGQAPLVKTLLVAPQTNPEGESNAIEALQHGLSAFPQVVLRAVTPQDYHPASGDDLYIFMDYLPEKLPKGSVLIVNPPIENALIEAGEPHANLSPITEPAADPLAADIDWRALRVDQLTPLSLPDWASVVVSTADGKPVIFRGRTDETTLVGLAFDLRDSNLPEKLAFPILLSNILTELAARHFPTALEPGLAYSVSPGRFQEDIRVMGADGQEWVLEPGFDPIFPGVFSPGLYTARGLDASGNRWEERFAVNVGASIESDLNPRVAPEASVVALPEPVSLQSDVEIWPGLVFALLAILAIESWLAKR